MQDFQYDSVDTDSSIRDIGNEGLDTRLLERKVCIVRIIRCCRCEREWCTRLENPYRCGKCGTPYWDKPRVRLAAIAKRRVTMERKPVERKAENTMAKMAEKHVPSVKPEPIRVETPKSEMPAPKCPRCREEMVDLGPEFSCGNENCSQKPIPRETIEYQFENRGQ
jgi:hypothetical protein